MPKDKRLYMTFPIDFDEHPKVALLSDAAFRAFISMNGYSRRQKLDGRIPAALATKKWKPRVLAELVASHSERPLVLLEGDTYVLRSYADHQFTNDDEAELHRVRAEAGKAGGEAKAKALALARETDQQNVARSESRSELDDQDLNMSGRSSETADRQTGNWPAQVERIIELIRDECGRTIDQLGAAAVILHIDKRRGEKAGPIKTPLPYFAKTIRNHTFEFQQFVDEKGLAL